MAKQETSTTENGFVIDFGKWKMKDKRAFMRAVREVQDTGDEGGLYPHYARVIKQWPFTELDPANPDEYDELEALQWKEVTEAVSEAIKSILS